MHPLVVHAVVVLLPLMSIVTVAVALRPVWRRYALPVVVVNAVVLVAAYAAKESGERLQARLQQFNPTVAQGHAQQGARVPYVALGVLVAAVLVWLTSRSARLVPVAVVVALVAGAAGIGGRIWPARAVPARCGNSRSQTPSRRWPTEAGAQSDG